MAYNQYGGNPYGAAPPGYGSFGTPPPGMAAPPGLGPSPGMVAAPGMAAPGVQQPPGAQQGSHPGIPPSFQPPANMPNINFNAPVIRLGTGASGSGGRGGDLSSPAGGGRAGLGMERGGEHGRDRGGREAQQVLVPPTADERLRTMAICLLPEGLGGDEGAQKICGAVGRFRKWEPSASLWTGHDQKLGFVLFDDHESISIAMKLLREEGVDVPVNRQPGTAEPPRDDSFEGIEKTKLHVSFDEATDEYHQSLDESQGDDPEFQNMLEAARQALGQVQRGLFYPPIGSRPDADGDTAMASVKNEAQDNVEVVNISIAQEDELADIPAEMREIVSKEIAAFRERSNQRDMERLRREEEIEEGHRRQNGASSAGANNIPLGPRAAAAPTGPRGQNGADQGVSFVNGGVQDRQLGVNEPGYDTDASDDELYRRILKKEAEEEHQKFLELERKWKNRERTRQLALDREREREQHEAEQLQRRKDEQFAEEMAWDDELEARRKTHPYYRDHAAWARQRAIDRAREEALDDADRREEEEEMRREKAQQERARGQADSFLDQQDREADRRQPAAAAAPAPAPFKLSLGAAARGAQASRAMPQRRTIAEVEGLLDDEDNEPSVRRPLVPIQMDAVSASAGMTEEEITQAVRALAQEIPSDKDGLWAWQVKWDYMDEGIVRERLRPFVEKKIVEYLGVQEEMLVETVEEHLRKHGSASALVEELEGALDDEAEDLVKKLWRMVIFFTESEKRGLPA